jgi:long-chain acyl-CoA synthetase
MMNLANWLMRTAQVSGDQPALFHGTDQIANYAELANMVQSCAAWLQDNGVAPGDHIGIFMKNTPEYLAVFYGIWAAGAVAVPINGKLHPKEADWILENAEAKFVFCCEGLGAALSEIECCVHVFVPALGDFEDGRSFHIVDRHSDDLAWLFYTSGTTGRPKGVMITHGMICQMALGYFADVDHVSAQDTALYAAPMSHGAGLYNIMHMRVGARNVVPKSGGFEEREIFELARHFGNVHMFAAPTMVKRMTQIAKEHGETGAGIRTIVYAGGPMYLADIIEAVDHFGPIFVQVYGQGECPMGITALSRQEVCDRTHPNWKERLKSVGRAQSTVEVQIGDENGNILPIGEIGEIMVRGDLVMPGYWKNPDASEKTLRNGWLQTGDMGAMDQDGYVTMHDRSKDMIISGGTNIYPREVEEVLMTHPDVIEASVVGRPNAEWGEDVVAFVVGDVSTDVLDDLCLSQIARFKRPKDYVFLDQLPKNNYGKVLKTVLRESFK